VTIVNRDQEFRGKHVLITGGLGFIGSNLAHRLVRAGAHVLLVDSLIPAYGGNLFNISGIQHLVRVNISDVRDVHGLTYLVQDEEYIFNLAGQVSHLDSVEDPLTDLDINTRAQLSLLEACRRHNPDVKIVFSSTRQIYGRPQYLPVDERHPIAPVDPNGISNAAGEWYHLLYSELHGVRACSLRLTNTYGPRMRVRDARQTFIGWWFRQLIEGNELQVYGDGTQVRDFNYVDDVLDALLLAALSPDSAGRVYNLGGPCVSLKSLAESLVQINGSGSYRMIPFPTDRKPIDIGDYYGDASKIETELGWRPKTELRRGLMETISFYRENARHYW
jgi:UDP-glucose 4-epimerase